MHSRRPLLFQVVSNSRFMLLKFVDRFAPHSGRGRVPVALVQKGVLGPKLYEC